MKGRMSVLDVSTQMSPLQVLVEQCRTGGEQVDRRQFYA